MTLENQVYGVAWVCCALCGVKQPLASLEYDKEAALHHCINEAKCAEWKADLAREAEAFRLSHPELHPAVPDPANPLCLNPDCGHSMDEHEEHPVSKLPACCLVMDGSEDGCSCQRFVLADDLEPSVPVPIKVNFKSCIHDLVPSTCGHCKIDELLAAVHESKPVTVADEEHETALIHAAWNEGRKAQRSHKTEDFTRIRARAAAAKRARK